MRSPMISPSSRSGAGLRAHNHRSSQVIRGHQRSSAVISGHHSSSELIRGHQRSSAVIRGHHSSSKVIIAHQCSSAQEERIQIIEEDVEAALEHAQPEALALADDVELRNRDLATRNTWQQQGGRRVEPVEDLP